MTVNNEARIWTSDTCNNRCLFCINSEKNRKKKSTRDIINELYRARSAKKTLLCFMGGENTIRPDIAELTITAKRIGFKEIYMSTNGRMFTYMNFAKKIIKAGITGLNFSIHGHTQKLHDSLTQTKGSFNEIIKGISNLKFLGFKNFSTTTVIVRPNFKYLPEICRLSYKLGSKNAAFSFVNPAYNRFDFGKLMPKITKISPYLIKCLYFRKTHKNFDCTINYMPLCLFPGFEKQISTPETRELETMLIKTVRCLNCSKYSACPGIWKSYLKLYGDSELKPFNFD